MTLFELSKNHVFQIFNKWSHIWNILVLFEVVFDRKTPIIAQYKKQINNFVTKMYSLSRKYCYFTSYSFISLFPLRGIKELSSASDRSMTKS